MPQIFMIGATGAVGGAVLDQICAAHPDIPITAVVRKPEHGKTLKAMYTNVETIPGHLGQFDKAVARQADIVINTAPDITHDGEIRALLASLRDGAYYIHTSGTTIIMTEPTGEADERVWDDVADVQELITRDAQWTHAPTDKVVREASPRINIANISPSMIDGLSPSPFHPTPLSYPAPINLVRQLGQGFQINAGRNRLARINVNDVAAMYMILVEDALQALAGADTASAGPFPRWGPEAYYFGVAEELSWREFMEVIVAAFREQKPELGVRDGKEGFKEMKTKEASMRLAFGDEWDQDKKPPAPDTWAMHIAIGVGVNMRATPSRMRALGWEPKEKSVRETVGEVLRVMMETGLVN